MTVLSRLGDVLVVGAEASVQFAGDRAIVLRVVSVCRKPTYHGWCWLTGYVLNRSGEAVDRREVFVRTAGLRHPRAPIGPGIRRVEVPPAR